MFFISRKYRKRDTKKFLMETKCSSFCKALSNDIGNDSNGKNPRLTQDYLDYYNEMSGTGKSPKHELHHLDSRSTFNSSVKKLKRQSLKKFI
jgi:hypothetical protein